MLEGWSWTGSDTAVPYKLVLNTKKLKIHYKVIKPNIVFSNDFLMIFQRESDRWKKEKIQQQFSRPKTCWKLFKNKKKQKKTWNEKLRFKNWIFFFEK